MGQTPYFHVNTDFNYKLIVDFGGRLPYLGTSTHRMSITKPSTNRRKKTQRPTSNQEIQVFPKRMGKICTGKTVLNYVKGLEIPLISEPFQNKIPDLTPESLTECCLLKIEIDKLLQKGAIEQMYSLEPGSFVSHSSISNGQRLNHCN